MKLAGRTLFCMVATLAPIATAAVAQEPPGGGAPGGQKGPPPHERKRPPVDEKAYKAALDRIPVPKEKYDPWGVARPTPSTKSKQK